MEDLAAKLREEEQEKDRDGFAKENRGEDDQARPGAGHTRLDIGEVGWATVEQVERTVPATESVERHRTTRPEAMMYDWTYSSRIVSEGRGRIIVTGTFNWW